MRVGEMAVISQLWLVVGWVFLQLVVKGIVLLHLDSHLNCENIRIHLKVVVAAVVRRQPEVMTSCQGEVIQAMDSERGVVIA